MAYKVEVSGLTIWCETIADLQALINSVTRDQPRNLRLNTPSSSRAAESPTLFPLNGGRSRSREEALTRAVAMLECVIAAGHGGISAADLAVGMKVKDARGLGGYATSASNFLAKAGFKFDKVIRQARNPSGVRTWYAGPDSERALAALKQAST